MSKMVADPDSKPGTERCESSSLSWGTKWHRGEIGYTQ